jgi:transcriptional regulator with XRE-family HTH domain
MTRAEKEHTLREFSARFRKALENRGYSPSQQKQLGKLFGVSGTAVRKWADGLAMPTSTRMPSIASKLGVRRAWLQDGEEPMIPEVGRLAEPKGKRKSSEELELSKEEASVVYDYRLLTSAQRKAIRELITIFKKGNKG